MADERRRRTDKPMGLIRAFLEFLDNRSVFRRVAFVWMMWLTTTATLWCFEYAGSKTFGDGMQTAAVIAAVMAPIAGLQAAIFKWYSESRSDDSVANS